MVKNMRFGYNWLQNDLKINSKVIFLRFYAENDHKIHVTYYYIIQ